jgi:hypothetical protein
MSSAAKQQKENPPEEGADYSLYTLHFFTLFCQRDQE